MIILTLGFFASLLVLFNLPFTFIVLPFHFTINMIIKIALSIVLYLQWLKAIKLHALKSTSKSISFLAQDSKGRWLCQTNSGQKAYGRILPGSFMNSAIIILLFKQLSRNTTIIIPCDSMETEEFRTLSARLKMRQN